MTRHSLSNDEGSNRGKGILLSVCSKPMIVYPSFLSEVETFSKSSQADHETNSSAPIAVFEISGRGGVGVYPVRISSLIPWKKSFVGRSC